MRSWHIFSVCFWPFELLIVCYFRWPHDLVDKCITKFVRWHVLGKNWVSQRRNFSICLIFDQVIDFIDFNFCWISVVTLFSLTMLHMLITKLFIVMLFVRLSFLSSNLSNICIERLYIWKINKTDVNLWPLQIVAYSNLLSGLLSKFL